MAPGGCMAGLLGIFSFWTTLLVSQHARSPLYGVFHF